MAGFTQHTGTTVVLNVSNIDTDQIIPARFLTTTSKQGLGKNLFDAWRYQEDGTSNLEFILNQEQAQNCSILVAGENFGCGSSREHAPWALLDYGFKVIISNKIADIFRNNALKNGLLAIVLDDSSHQQLLAQPGIELSVSLQSNTITYIDQQNKQQEIEFTLDPFARQCLLQGVDQLGYLLNQNTEISKFEEEHA